MPQLKLPEHVISDLDRFIYEIYSQYLPNSLLVAQAFILKYPHHGRVYGLPAINYEIEQRIQEGTFNIS